MPTASYLINNKRTQPEYKEAPSSPQETIRTRKILLPETAPKPLQKHAPHGKVIIKDKI